MHAHEHNGEYPRSLSPREREWIEWILPPDRPAYQSYRALISTMMVIGRGRRGAGEIILGGSTEMPDFSEPLSSVAAYGAIETNVGTISITLREPASDQISVEIVSHHSDDIPSQFEEQRRWTYSTWLPAHHCPQCLRACREVPMHSNAAADTAFVLTFCTTDNRLWVYDSASGMVRLIPMTNYYNELMLHKNIRDPHIALDAKRLFRQLSDYTDADLAYAFLTYNTMRTKFQVSGRIEVSAEEPNLLRKTINKLFNIH
jgi:hypothetical protein